MSLTQPDPPPGLSMQGIGNGDLVITTLSPGFSSANSRPSRVNSAGDRASGEI
jgi:hypothetical protein